MRKMDIFRHRALKFVGGMILVGMIPWLAGCSKGEPIQLTDHNYIGAWIHKEDANENGIRIDNRLLAFYDDSTVSYFRCTKIGGSSKRVSLPEAYISKLTDTELMIEADLFVTTAKLKFKIQAPPYQRDGDWYMKVDGVQFRKMHPGEKSDQESWPCHSDDDNEF